MNELAEEVKGKYFPVLDYGFVALLDYMGEDQDIARAARVSYGAGTRAVNDDRNLIRHLKRHLHTGPFEQCELKFHHRLPIFVARQLIRHRTANVNEYSLRYSLPSMQYYIPTFDQFQKQSKSNRQGRDGAADIAVYERALRTWQELQASDSQLYEFFMGEDIARELSRLHLPVSLYTEWYWKIDLHNLMHALTLRSDSHAQWEIQQYSNMMAGIMKHAFPVSYEAWMDYQFYGVRLSRMEWDWIVSQINGTPHPKIEETLSKTEIKEFQAKLDRPTSPPDFVLDLSQAKTADYFRERMEWAVPGNVKATALA